MTYEQDYILRLIQRVGVILRAMVKAEREHRPDDALRLSDEALHHVTGLSAETAETASVGNLLLIMSAGGMLDVKRAILLAEVLAQRADAFEMAGDSGAAERERRRAEGLAKAASDAAGDSEDGDRARMLLGTIEGELAPGTGGLTEHGTEHG